MTRSGREGYFDWASAFALTAHARASAASDTNLERVLIGLPPSANQGIGYSIWHMTGVSFSVLRLLADGDFHSGSAIARELGVSRGTVWNAVRDLEAAGLDVYRVRSRGYRLPQPVSLLDRDTIARHAGVE